MSITGADFTQWTYDPRGRVSNEAKQITGGGQFVTEFTYNSADLPVTMTYPDGEIVNFAYNSNMLPVSVSGTSTYAQTIAYDSANRMIQLMRGANKINTVYTYNNWNVDGGRLLNLTSTQVSTGDPLQNSTYDYDSVGNINTITDSLSGPQTQTFTYDELDRLLTSNVTGGTDGLYTEGYSYDPSTGNLASKNSATYTYSTTHKHAATSLSNGNAYGYDQNGNMTSRHVFEGTEFKDYTLNYDAENRLVSVSGGATASFKYDGDGKQVKATVNGVTAVYVGQHYEVKSSVVSKYYFAGSTRLAVRTDGTLRFLLGDHLGSSSVTTNIYGTKIASALYKAFGETRYTLGNLNTDYKFTGQREEASLGIYFFQARWYDGSLGRFLSPDTIVPTSTQGTQAWDRYAFVNNNPVRYTDPTGHCAQDIEPEECEFMKSHQTEGGGVAGASSRAEGDGGGNGDSSTIEQEHVNNPIKYPLTFSGNHFYDKNNVLIKEPIYDYSYSPPKLIGYHVTSYAIDDVHFSLLNFIIPSDALTWTSTITDYGLKPLLKPGIKNLASVGIEFGTCPVCGALLTIAAGLDSLNSAFTFDGHLRTYDQYFYDPILATPFDNQFRIQLP